MSSNKTLLHIPHSSKVIPEEWLPFFQITEGELRRELVAMTDSFTDQLFDLEGAGKLIFPVSRLLVAPERFERDEGTGEKSDGFQRTKEAVTSALQRIL